MNIELARLRYAFDRAEFYGIATAPANNMAEMHRRALAQHVRVSSRVLPRVARSVESAADNLSIGGDILAFVFASPETNAYCCSDTNGKATMVFVSSAMVKLLNEPELSFVVGHELGHHIFAHYQYPAVAEGQANLRLLELRRSAEISADRAGLVACRNLDTSLAATLKVASGLGAEDLEIDILEYVQQVRDLKSSSGDESLLHSTHPPFPFRARALLRFDSVLSHLLAGEPIESVLREVDESIRRDMEGAIDRNAHADLISMATTAAFWRAAYEVCQQGNFPENEQARMVDHFGIEKVSALKRMLATMSKSEARAFLEKKRVDADAALQSAPTFVTRAADQRISAFRSLPM